MSEFCSTKVEGHVFVIAMNSPPVNALTPSAHLKLADAFNEFKANKDLFVAIITGEGNTFCAGTDIYWEAEGNPNVFSPFGFAGITDRQDLDKPVIAAVNGPAIGGGSEIALACELVIAAESATFALPEVRLGRVARAGGLIRMPRAATYQQAMGMILTGNKVSANQGLSMGFVNEVVPDGESLNTAMKWAEDIIKCSQLAIQTSLRIVKRGLKHSDVRDAITAGDSLEDIEMLMQSADYEEGIMAFVQKREPVWAH